MSKVTVNPANVTCIDDFYPITLYNTSAVSFARDFLYPLLNLKDTEKMTELDCNALNDKRMTYVVFLGVSVLILFIVLLTFIIYYFLAAYNLIGDTELNEENTKKIESMLLDILPNDSNQVELNNSFKCDNDKSDSEDNKSCNSDDEPLDYFRPQISNDIPIEKFHNYDFIFPLLPNDYELHMKMLLSQLTARNESVQDSFVNKAVNSLAQTYQKARNFSGRIISNLVEISVRIID